MIAIFHDLIGHMLEVYIDDIVVKSDFMKDHVADLRKAFEWWIGKWTIAISEFAFKYVSQKTVKGQALADFLADHLCLEVKDEMDPIEIASISLTSWKLSFDKSRTQTLAGVGIGRKTQFSFQLTFECLNNQPEYEASIIGLEILKELRVCTIEIIGDSILALKHLTGEYNCHSLALSEYYMVANQLMQSFDDVILQHVPRELNFEANEMA
ncbi:uncharacterized protein LOC132803766 [Ziziphus jujuba]|uniref:Uncharacterized protein LOC132803766 n=1 Tax=Ziziphus jujuba TaxID=326968 RepID=A0ABM4A964_ZIZJJ|nr:uncharacterized protein LOC132803766 [Ziziphus jujuba]